MKDRRRLAWQWCPVNPTHQPPLNPHGLCPTRYGNFLMLCALPALAGALRDLHYPAAPDSVSQLADILCNGLLDSAGPESTSRIVAALVKRLDRNTGSRLFAAYIQSAGK
jgi:hypothetical protein